MTTEQSASSAARVDDLKSLPPGVIPSPRTGDASESLPASRPSKRGAVIAGMALVAAGVGVTALLVSGSPGPSAAPTAPVERSAADVGFLKTVRQQPAFAGTSDDDLIKTGHSLCDQLRGGANPDQIALASIGKAYAVDDVSTALGAAAGAYCPDQMARVGAVG
ncbi:MAG TPA: DUF732 domain-containing protein [Pseudonocardia sp.]|jgi:hypothetical protein|nr:DUF732 domain-containing protein [Pseudonocardia sp.]